ncbi:MAG: hotdog fold domain-containing protein [Candidatus Moraniibacteriota bacterium]
MFTPEEIHNPGQFPSQKRFLTFDKTGLMNLLPHSGEALVIDLVYLDLLEKDAIGFLHVGGPNCHLLHGHFGIMPGHWLFEFANLTCAALGLSLLGAERKTRGDEKKPTVLLTGADGIRNHRKAVPGDEIRCNASFLRQDRREIFFSAEIYNAATKKKICSIKEISGTAL